MSCQTTLTTQSLIIILHIGSINNLCVYNKLLEVGIITDMHKINAKLTEWNLKDLLESDDDPRVSQIQDLLAKTNDEFVKKWENRDDYLKDPKVLKQALDEYDGLDTNFGDTGAVFYYYWLRSHQDQENTEIKAKYNKAEELSIKLANDIQFFTYRIAKIPESEQAVFLEAPELADYRHFLELEFRSAKYLLSEPEEKILNLFPVEESYPVPEQIMR